MRIITWNVNGIRAVTNKGELQNLINTYDPDILFLQEIKAGLDKLSPELLAPTPYIAYYNPAEKPGYAGTGVWVHERILEDSDIEFCSSFPDDPTANEGRVAHLVVTNKASKRVIDMFGIYFPNGGKSDQAWKDKLVFYSAFGVYMDSLRALGHSVLWGGDINCAHQAIDLARSRENDGKIGFHPLERAWLDNRTQDSWHDVWREKNPTQADVYSWWDPVTRSRDRNVGWRIDAIWTEDSLLPHIQDIRYLQDQMGSDHCPMMMEVECG